MASQARFAWARARSGTRPLLALAIIAAIASLLLTGLLGAVRAFESAGVMDAVERASDDRGELVVTFEVGRTEVQRRAIDAALDAIGVGDALSVEEVGGGRFVLRPDPARFSGDELIALRAGNAFIVREIGNAGGGTARVSGGLITTVSPLVEGITLRRGPTSMAIGIVALLAVVVVAAAAVEPVRRRHEERALLRARGMSKARLARLALAESIPVLLLSATAGAAAATGVTWLWSGTIMPVWAPATVAALLTIAGAVTVAAATLRDVDRRSTRADVLAGVTALVLLAVLTGLSAWQFWRTGSPVISLGSGRMAIDPLIALAPALALALFALLAVVLARPVAALLALPAAVSRKLQPVLSLRLASRRTSRHALTTGTVSFAAATICLALVYLGTLQALGSLPEVLRVGSDVRVISVQGDADRQAIRNLPGVEASMRARVLGVRNPGTNFPMLAVESSQLGQVMLDADGAIDPEELSRAIAIPPFGIEIPATARVLTVDMQVAPGEKVIWEDQEYIMDPLAADVGVTIADAAGQISRHEVRNHDRTIYETTENTEWGQSSIREQDTQQILLPGTGPWRVLSIVAQQPEHSWVGNGWLRLRLSAEGAAIDLSGMLGGSNVEITGEQLTLYLGLAANPGASNPPTPAFTGDAPRHYPAVITEDLAATLNAGVGSTFSLALASIPVTVDVRIVQIVPLIPGIARGNGLLVDLFAVNIGSQEPPVDNELWLRSDDPAALVDAVAGTVQSVQIDAVGPGTAASAFQTVLSFLLAAAGAVALAIVVLLLRRSRGEAERELGVLAVLGLGRRGGARVRAAEDVFAILVGILGGVAAGLAASWLIVPSLARAAYARTTADIVVPVTVPWPLLAVVVLAAGALFVAIAASVRAPRSLARALREAE